MAEREQRGVVLLIVLFFALLLSASIATFLKRATVDAILSRNRDAMTRADALARGGVRLATALLIVDKAADTAGSEGAGGTRMDTGLDGWAQTRNTTIEARGGAKLRLEIEDTGSKLNLNALFRIGSEDPVSDRTEAFLLALLEKVIDEMPLEQQATYDARELADNLIDYVDEDDVRRAGGLEDDYYQDQTPPYHAANRPLLSVDEIGMIEGFDAALVEVIRPYVTVYPFAGGGGVNPNTAPAHILSLIFYNDGVDLRFVQEDEVRRILEARQEGRIFCTGQSEETCTPMSEIVPNSESIHPPLSYYSDTFAIHSEASVGEVKRTVEAVIDRTVLEDPQLLSWSVW